MIYSLYEIGIKKAKQQTKASAFFWESIKGRDDKSRLALCGAGGFHGDLPAPGVILVIHSNGSVGFYQLGNVRSH